MKIYSKLLLITCLFFISFSAIAMKQDIDDGDYRIRCHTKNGGIRCLEAFPQADNNEGVVRPRPELSDQAQKGYQQWSIKSLGNGYYNITCFQHYTKHEVRYLEAFPNADVVRPRPKSGDQDQIWSIKHIDGDYYHISCNTRNGEVRYLEAFPNDDVVRPRPESSDQDQRWQFIKWQYTEDEDHEYTTTFRPRCSLFMLPTNHG